MKKGTPTHTNDINGNTIKMGDIVTYDFEDNTAMFEVVFEENAFRKKYIGRKWGKSIPRPILGRTHEAKEMRMLILNLGTPHERRL